MKNIQLVKNENFTPDAVTVNEEIIILNNENIGYLTTCRYKNSDLYYHVALPIDIDSEKTEFLFGHGDSKEEAFIDVFINGPKRLKKTLEILITIAIEAGFIDI